MDHFQLNVVVTSIIRPASNQSIHTWVSRLHGEPWAPPHPLLMPVLEETLGVMVFQEQLSQAAIHLAGFDPGEADMLRKVVSKKHREKKLRDFAARFVRGARDRGVTPEVIQEVWDMMMGFDGYSFCKPHSASYTLVAYKSAFLRAHYPAEFMAAVISNGGGYYSTFGYISEARRMGLRVLPPHINHSEIKYTGKGRTIRVGLMQLKDLSGQARDAIMHERDRNGPFVSFEDFLERTRGHAHLQDVRILIKGGCFDGISGGVPRPRLVWQALRFFDHEEEAPNLFSVSVKKIPPGPPFKKGGTVNDPPFTRGDTGGFFESNPAPPFFSMADPDPGGTGGGGSRSRRRPELPPYSQEIVLKHEEETLGFLLSIHPLDRHRERLKGFRYVRARELRDHMGKRVTLIGWQITGKTVHTKDGEDMKFVSFEDTTGIYETVFFPKAYNRFCHMLNAARPYILKGRVEEAFGALTLNVEDLRFLDAHGRARPRIFMEGV
jgi:error-prone DNA polymerase